MNRLPLVAALASVLLVGQFASAAVDVGAEPKLSFKATTGQQFELASMKGKYVLVDFWATWCGPCMAEAEHMVAINDSYGPRGLVLVGVSLDRDLAAMNAVCKEKKFTWVQNFGPSASAMSSEWGVTGIPRTFLIDSLGKVVWVGHPAQLDKVLKDAFEKNPPVLMDAKAFASAQAAIAGVQEHLTAKNPAAALKALAAIPPLAKEDTRTAAKVVELQKSVETAAEGMLTEVQPLIDKKDFAGALGRLRDISASMKGTPTGDKSKQMLEELSAKPEVKSQLAALERASKASVELDAARQMQTNKQHEQAYARFKVIATQFTGTPAALEASGQVATYEKDAAFMKKMNESAVATKAKGAINLAKAYASSGKTDLAIKKLQSVIDEFPGTTYAEEAKREMAAVRR